MPSNSVKINEMKTERIKERNRYVHNYTGEFNTSLSVTGGTRQKYQLVCKI